MKNYFYFPSILRGLIIALLLGAAQSFMLTAFAATDDVDDWDKLVAAVGSGGTASTVSLTDDITGDTQLTIARNLTLNLNGKSLTITVSSGNGIKIANGVTLTIMDSNPSGTNKLTVASGDGAGIGGSYTGSAGNITITGGTITATKGNSNDKGDIGPGSYGDGGTVTITGGSSKPVTLAPNNGVGVVTVYYEGINFTTSADSLYIKV